MNLLPRQMTSEEFERWTSLGSVKLRDWRRRQLFRTITGADILGELGENGRWTYSLHDVLTVTFARYLEKQGFNLEWAMWMGWVSANYFLESWLVGKLKSARHIRYVVFWNMADAEARGYEPLQDMSVVELPNRVTAVSLVIDLLHMMAEIPDDLLNELRKQVNQISKA